MTQLRIASDLHLEGFTGRDGATLAIDFIPRDPRDATSTLVLAGDISSHPDQLFTFVKFLLPRFNGVVLIPGNHEYYRHNYVAWNKEMRDRFAPLAADGLFFAAGEVRMSAIDDAVIVYGTMWGDGGPTLADRASIGYYLNDFRLIQMPGHDGQHYQIPRRFSVDDMMAIYKREKAFIAEQLALAVGRKRIVVTHHLPSRRLVSARFWPQNGSDGQNGGFVGDCDDILESDASPDLWIHGHTHDTIDTVLSTGDRKTRVVCNPAGYRKEWCTSFNHFMDGSTASDAPAIVIPKFVEI